MKRQLNYRRLTTLLVASCTLLVASSVLADNPKASADASSSAVGGCKPSAVSATDAHHQLIALSSIIDPSGKLSKIINDYHPETSAGHSHQHEADPMQVAASEIEPVKRAADEEQTVAANATTVSTAQEAIKALVTAATENNVTSSTAAPVIVVKSEQQAPASSVNASATTPAPKIAETTAASNVTVNVFLQVAPDSKADELINNPDKAIASSTTEAPSAASNSSTPSAESATSSNNSTAAPTQASVPVAMNSTAQASASAIPTSQQQQPAAVASVKPNQSRRRRRWANPAAAPAPATQAPAPAPKASPSSTTSTTSTTTTTTTTTTTAAPSTTSSTTTAPSTTSAAQSTTTATTNATPVKPKASVTTTVPTVELSAKDLAVAASNERSAPTKTAETPIEIVVSSVASSPAAPAAPAPSATTSTTTAKPTDAPSSTTTSTTTTTTTSTTSTTPKPSTSAASTAPQVAAAAPAVRAVEVKPVEVAPPAPSVAAAAAPPVPAGIEIPIASVASLKPTESKLPGMQLIDSNEESTNHLNIPKTRLEHSKQINKEQKTTITKLHHSNEVKREIEAGSQQQQLASVYHHPHEQQDSSERASPLDKTSESSLDNSNVIYDNDGEHINLTYPTPESNSPTTKTNGDQSIVGDIKQSSVGMQQIGSKSLKHFVMDAVNCNKTASSSSSSTSSFVHREHADETQETQDNYATCLLVEPNLVKANIIVKLVGRLNFWQPIQNRGVAHLIARFRYEYNLNQINANQTVIGEQVDRLRRKRESFQTLIERAPPSMKDQPETTMTRPSQLIHQIWLHDESDCATITNTTIIQVDRPHRRLVAELKATIVNGTIDVDSEVVVGHLNLTETNSILNKCLRMNLLLANDTDSENLTPSIQGNSEQKQLKELSVGHCKIVQSDNLPPVNELEQSPSVASNIQPLREDLLVSGSSLTPSSATTTTKTAPSNRKALFELM